MAQRRMFSPKIVSSDAFLDMPTSSRELYFQLGMFADDDGFINPRKIVRMIGASEDDLKVLIAKRFVIPFENGVVVIKHWAINNLIRKDFYRETIYLEEKGLLKLKDNGSYTEKDKSVNNPLTNCSRRLGKDRLGKDRLDNTSVSDETQITENIQEKIDLNCLIELFKPVNPNYTDIYKNKTQRKALEELVEKHGVEKITRTLQILPATIGQKYAPVITTPLQLKNKLGSLIAFVQRQQQAKVKVAAPFKP